MVVVVVGGAQVLGMSGAVPMDASFFELGGDSMRAGLLNSLLRKVGGTAVTGMRDSCW